MDESLDDSNELTEGVFRTCRGCGEGDSTVDLIWVSDGD
jgi:hypothetical protein